MDYLQGRLISSIETHHRHQEWLAFLITSTSSSWMNMVERFFRDITVYLRDGSFSSTRELASSITTFLALHNAQPCRYVWSAKGEDILRKIQSAREAMSSTTEENVLYETGH